MKKKMRGKIGVSVVFGLLLLSSLATIVKAEDKGEKIFDDNVLLTKKESRQWLFGEYNDDKKITIKIVSHDPFNAVNISLKKQGNDARIVPQSKKTNVLNLTYSFEISPGKYDIYLEEVGNYSDKPISERGANVYITVWAKDTGVINNGDTPGFLVSTLLVAVPLSVLILKLEREKRRKKE